MEVLGVGFGRTGTASLRAALERLGLSPCDHMLEVMDQPHRVRMWRRIGEGERPDWAEVFAGYRASVDWPGAAYWQELVDAFPEAKVILTVRDPERWFESAFKTIFRFPMRRHSSIQRAVFAMAGKIHPPSAQVPLMIDKVLWDRVFDGRVFDGREGDRDYAIERFHRHNEEVKAYVSPERLLVFDVAEGWKPLCDFLGTRVPDEPFPRINDAKAFNRGIDARVRGTMVPLAAGFAAVSAIVAGALAAAIGGANAAAGIAAVAAAAMALLGFGVTNGLVYLTERRRERRVGIS